MYDFLNEMEILSDLMKDAVDQCIFPNIVKKTCAWASTKILTT